MAENGTINLNAHYSTSSKVQKPIRTVAAMPANMPHTHLFNDIDANKKMAAINKHIYNGTQKEKTKSDKTFWKIFGGIALAILGIKGIQKIVSFFK